MSTDVVGARRVARDPQLPASALSHGRIVREASRFPPLVLLPSVPESIPLPVHEPVIGLSKRAPSTHHLGEPYLLYEV